MPTRFGEHYTRSGQRASYHLTYVETSRGVAWHAIVRDADGNLLGTPNGRIPLANLSTPDIDARLDQAVHTAVSAIDV
jgi:hypothetical protein